MADGDFILSTQTFADLAAIHPGIEVWRDEGRTDAGYSYFWLVSKENEAVRQLAYLRLRQGKLQKRCYDDQGEDMWVGVE